MQHKGNSRRSGFGSFDRFSQLIFVNLFLGKSKKKFVQPINSIENLSNEIFYEIFAYLDGYDISRSFYKLNQRFENLVNNSSSKMKIQINSTTVFDDYYKEFLELHHYHIQSLHIFDEEIINQFVSSCLIDLPYKCLQSIIFNPISTYKLLVLLFYLKNLSCLLSLTVTLDDFSDELGDIYQLVFRLPYLKYLKIEIEDSDPISIDIPLLNNEKYSSVEHLGVYHACSFNQLINLLSYTPKLSHLYCANMVKSTGKNRSKHFIELNNLTHFTIGIDNVRFGEFEEFLSKISFPLDSLKVFGESLDINYLNSYRWEQLIKEHLPRLNQFNLRYTDIINGEFQMSCSHSLIKGFTSSFWQDHQWRFKFEIKNNRLNYIIRPYVYRPFFCFVFIFKDFLFLEKIGLNISKRIILLFHN